MGILKFARGANYRGFYEKLKVIAKKKRVPAPLLFVDGAFSTLIYGSGLQDYLNYEFYDRSPSERAKYATIRVQQNLYDKVNPREFRHFFANKTEFYEKYRGYMNRLMFCPASEGPDALAAFLESSPDFIEKPRSGTGGKGIAIRKAGEIGDAREYYEKLRADDVILEELIVQHPDLSRLCPRCVNTLRIMTSAADPDDPVIIFAALRVGDGHHDVDNFHSGGMGMLVNPETGRVEGDALDKNVERFSVHPVTGEKFDGFAIPFWTETRELVKSASGVIPEMTVVGWDVAITPSGPVIVEGNATPGFDMVQVDYGRGRKDIADDVLKTYKRCRKKAAREKNK
ncbi:MAG: hypothetical protein IKX86_00990 [Clostridia bacterium]|nr:hypothetical protein [Clostridia bacterium]MBR5767237.1 hypothetical protein [Clostridia bacterium]